MRKTVEEVLYLNRMERETECSEVEIKSMILRQLSNYEVMIREKDLITEIEPDAENIEETGMAEKGIERICTNEALFEKIVDNLLANAVTYSPPGGRILVQIQNDRIVIRNSGIQISEELLPHIFEPFVSGSTGGCCQGLGLYIAHYYAEKLGMRLSLTNERVEQDGQKEYPWVKSELIFDHVCKGNRHA